MANLPLSTIAMESCGGANYWARVFHHQGHIVKLISPQFVKPFVKTNKIDVVGANQSIIVALDWSSFFYDEQSMLSLNVVTSKGLSTPLLWKSVCQFTNEV